MKLHPFFCYYEGKSRAARHYPMPKHGLVVEPFAGAAGYSLHHYSKEILLCDSDPVIRNLWKWLISVPAQRILQLPDLLPGQTLDDIDLIPEEKHFIGFWLNKGTTRPSKSPSAWMRGGTRPNSYWGPAVRERLAPQVDLIRHWRVADAVTYETLDDIPATWFIDPPYQKAGCHYAHGSSRLNYPALAQWCQTRRGQTIVCENEGADWLPFSSFRAIQSNPSARGGKVSREAIWLNEAA